MERSFTEADALVEQACGILACRLEIASGGCRSDPRPGLTSFHVSTGALWKGKPPRKAHAKKASPRGSVGSRVVAPAAPLPQPMLARSARFPGAGNGPSRSSGMASEDS
jgi:hypothetical protein